MIMATICFAQIAAAQDKIYLTDGKLIEAKVKEIGPKNVVYKRWDNQDGADYILARREVIRIVYQNGTEEKINRSFSGPGRPPMADRDESVRSGNKKGDMGEYGKNIIAIAPIQMTNESVSGIGIHYERIMDKDGMFSIYLPVAISFYDEEAGVNLKESRTFVNAYPGLKIYPGGSGRRVSYSVGASFGFGFGNKFKEVRVQDPITGSYTLTYKDASLFKTGFMVNNGLNIQPTKHFYVGLEFGIGILYYNNEKTDYTVGEEPFVQFNFKMGYRF
jgi:hypothetical protein